MTKLEKFEKPDFDRLISWVDSEKFMFQFAGPIFHFPITNEQLELYISDKDRYAFKVIFLETGEVIGHSEIYNSGNNVTKLCRILLGDKNFRGKGLGKEMVEKLAEFSFNNLLSTTIELNVVNWNTSAIKCYEKVGFVINPLKTSTTQFKNEEWISYNMILDKVEWGKNKNSNPFLSV